MVGDSRREFTRLPIKMQATLRASHDELFCPRTGDISLRGMYAFSTDPFAIGTDVSITLRFDRSEEGLSIRLSGRVVNVDAGGMGIEFTAMSVGALEQMRMLLLYNAADPQQIEGEFNSHIGLKRR
jgi:hypothetical protein